MGLAGVQAASSKQASGIKHQAANIENLGFNTLARNQEIVFVQTLKFLTGVYFSGEGVWLIDGQTHIIVIQTFFMIFIIF